MNYEVVVNQGTRLISNGSTCKLALIFPEVISAPKGGGRMRIFQLQTLLARLFEGNVVAWDLERDRAVDLLAENPLETAQSGNVPAASRTDIRKTIRDLAALALYTWPRFVVHRTDTSIRERILRWIDLERPTHVVLVHPFAIDLIPQLSRRNIEVIIDCQNVESDLAQQISAVNVAESRRLEAVLARRTTARWEQLYFRNVSQVWLPSTNDIARQRQISSDQTRFLCVPNALDLSQYPDCSEPGRSEDIESATDIALPGSFAYGPNVVAAHVLRDRVFPTVKQSIPQARLVLVGRDDRGLAADLAREPNVVATGMVPDTRPYLRDAGVVVVPILQGSGTRFKILEALALGRPVVTTALGAEGLNVRDGEHLLIREIDEFPNAIVSVLRHPEFGMQLGREGRKLVERQYSWDVVESILREAFDLGGERRSA